MRAKKMYLTVIAVAVLVFIGMAGLSKKNTAKTQESKTAESKAAESSTNTQDAVQQKVLSFNLEGLTDKGAKSWEVNGDAAEAISEHEVKLDNIVAKAYGDEAEATITADKGVYDKDKNNVRLQQNVKATIVNKQGGSGGYLDVAGQVAKAASDPKKEEESASRKTSTITITCDGEVQFDYIHNLAYFEKNVLVTSSDGTIDADKITVNMEPKTKKVTDIVAQGHVKIVRGGNVTYSDKATYVEADKKVVLTGRPKIVISQEGTSELNILGK